MNPLTGAAAAYTNIVVLSIEPRLQKRVTGIGCKQVDNLRSGVFFFFEERTRREEKKITPDTFI